MTNFYEKLELAILTGKISMECALQLSKQHEEEVAAIKEARKYARPRNGFSRVTKRLQWI